MPLNIVDDRNNMNQLENKTGQGMSPHIKQHQQKK